MGEEKTSRFSIYFSPSLVQILTSSGKRALKASPLRVETAAGVIVRKSQQGKKRFFSFRKSAAVVADEKKMKIPLARCYSAVAFFAPHFFASPKGLCYSKHFFFCFC